MAKRLETESVASHSFQSCSMEHPSRLKSSEKVTGYLGTDSRKPNSQGRDRLYKVNEGEKGV